MPAFDLVGCPPGLRPLRLAPEGAPRRPAEARGPDDDGAWLNFTLFGDPFAGPAPRLAVVGFFPEVPTAFWFRAALGELLPRRETVPLPVTVLDRGAPPVLEEDADLVGGDFFMSGSVFDPEKWESDQSR